MIFSINQDEKVNLPVERRLKCYVFGGLMSEYNVRIYSDRKSKANWLAFKNHGNDFGFSDFIEFCKEVESCRFELDDAYEFSSVLKFPLSKGAEILLKSSSCIIEQATDLIFIPNGSPAEITAFLEELITNELVSLEKEIEHGAFYRISIKGLKERLSLFSLEYHISEDEVSCLFSKADSGDIEPAIYLDEIKELLKAQNLKKDSFESLPEALLRSKVRIHSGEWGSWWGDNGSGYTSKKNKAGTYSLKSALSHSGHCGPSKKIKYVFLN